MGVAGSGKSTIGAAFAHALDVPFVEGDVYHPAANVQRMSLGIPLTDEDRTPWLRALGLRLREAHDAGSGLVMSCSALKRAYRDLLRAEARPLQFIYLKGEPALIAQRLAGRSGHFMPASLLESQFATLEEPAPNEHAWICDIRRTPEELIAELVFRAQHAV